MCPPYYACKAGEPVNCQITHTQQPFSSHQKLEPKSFWHLKKRDVVKIWSTFPDFAWITSVEWNWSHVLLTLLYYTTLMTHRNCLLMATNNTHTSLLKPDVMHNYTFFMPSSETWEKAFFVLINHLSVINDKVWTFSPFPFMILFYLQSPNLIFIMFITPNENQVGGL